MEREGKKIEGNNKRQDESKRSSRTNRNKMAQEQAEEQAEEQGQDQSSEPATKKAMGRKESAAVNRQSRVCLDGSEKFSRKLFAT